MSLATLNRDKMFSNSESTYQEPQKITTSALVVDSQSNRSEKFKSKNQKESLKTSSLNNLSDFSKTNQEIGTDGIEDFDQFFLEDPDQFFDTQFLIESRNNIQEVVRESQKCKKATHDLDEVVRNSQTCKKPRLESSSSPCDSPSKNGKFNSKNLTKKMSNDKVEEFQDLDSAKQFLKEIQDTIDHAARLGNGITDVDDSSSNLNSGSIIDNDHLSSFPENGASKFAASKLKTGESFICQDCKMLFRQKLELVKHMDVVHRGQEFPFKCKHCGDMFSVLKQLQVKHISSKNEWNDTYFLFKKNPKGYPNKGSGLAHW